MSVEVSNKTVKKRSKQMVHRIVTLDEMKITTLTKVVHGEQNEEKLPSNLERF
jgi:hypothetical protein